MSSLANSVLFSGGIKRTFVMLVLIALIPVFVVQAWVYFNWFASGRVQQRAANLEYARAIGAAFREFIRDVTRQEATMGDALYALLPYEPQQANDFLARAVAEYHSVTSFRWTGPSGKVISSSDPQAIGVDLSDREYFKRVSGGAEWTASDLITDRVTLLPTIIVARGVRDDKGAFVGAVLASIDLTLLGENVIPADRPQRGVIFVFDRAGTLVYRRPEAGPSRWEAPKVDLLLTSALAGKEATGESFAPVTNERYISARVPIPDIGWVAGAGTPYSLVMTPVMRSLAFDLAVLAAISVFSLLVAFFLSGVVAAAVRGLKVHAQAVGAGDLARRAEVSGIREFSDLALEFNSMASLLAQRGRSEQAAGDALKRANENLEKEVIDRKLAEDAVRLRSAELEASNRELEAFAYSVSHDLRAPLRAVDGFSLALLEDYAAVLDERGRDYLQRARAASQRMGVLIDDLLGLSRVTRAPMKRQKIDLSRMAADIADELVRQEPGRKAEFTIEKGLVADGDPELIRSALENLIGNAWKFTRTRADATIEFGAGTHKEAVAYFVRDNGVGFDMAYADKLFAPFQRLHSASEFPGTGVGLAAVERVIRRHGGSVWADSAVGDGATFFFTLADGGSA